MTETWETNGFDKVTCADCSAEFDSYGKMTQHAQVAHGVDVDS